jgi:hypothetical protein
MRLVNELGRVLIYLLLIAAFGYVVYRVVEDKPVPATGNHDVYERLQEPLIATIRDHGKTLTTDKQGSQLYEFTFNGYMTELPYTVVMSRNVDFNDCAGCIGDWEKGMLSPPTYRDSLFIPLDEFIVQMVRAKQNVFDTKSNKLAPMEWDAGSYHWKVSIPNQQGLWRIEVLDNRLTNHWEVYTRLESIHLPNQ